jgi:hypothetical protein
LSGDERANPAGNAIQLLRKVTEVSQRLQQQSHIAAACFSAALLLKLAQCDAPIVQHLGQFEDRARKACGGASRRSGIKVVSFPSNLVTMTTIVGVFDNARNLDKAVERLARAGFEDTLYDEAIVEGEAGNGGGSLVFAPGYAAAMVWGTAEPESRPKRSKHGQHTIVEAFTAHLAEYDVPAEVIQASRLPRLYRAAGPFTGRWTRRRRTLTGSRDGQRIPSPCHGY